MYVWNYAKMGLLKWAKTIKSPRNTQEKRMIWCNGTDTASCKDGCTNLKGKRSNLN